MPEWGEKKHNLYDSVDVYDIDVALEHKFSHGSTKQYDHFMVTVYGDCNLDDTVADFKAVSDD